MKGLVKDIFKALLKERCYETVKIFNPGGSWEHVLYFHMKANAMWFGSCAIAVPYSIFYINVLFFFK